MSGSRKSSAARQSKSGSEPSVSSCCFGLDQFTSAPPEKLRCPVDGKILRDAVSSRVCGHVFGLQCAIYYSIEHEKCPVCGKPMDASDLVPHDAFRDHVAELTACCPERPRCQWSGPMRERATHCNGPKCKVQRVDCPFCNLKGIESGEPFEQHKQVCQDCVVICPHCFEDMPRHCLATHERGCTRQAIEPLRRQQENIARAAREAVAPLAATASPAPQQQQRSNPTESGNNNTSFEEIDKEDDDAGLGGYSPAPKQPTATPIHVDASVHLAVEEVRSNLQRVPESQPPTASDDDFSPAPPPATVPTTRDGSLDECTSAEEAELRGPCPFGEMGCAEQHTTKELQQAAVQQHHLMVLCRALHDVRAQCGSLQRHCEALQGTVDQQKKTIKMLEVRSALHSGKLSVAPVQQEKKSAGLVDSPRQATDRSPATAAAASQSCTVPAAAEASGTPHKQRGQATSSINRSASSPADRRVNPQPPTLVPTMPKKSRPVGAAQQAAGVAATRSSANGLH